ncbi:hypothetical protein T484DRAFT_1811390 [Baffinella frigidus]|nr:hypothetical protein T484DRAFT_1811390 [Cryptophyta sp. CCMP2293]
MNFLCGGRFKIPANLAGGGLEPPAWVKDSDAPACGVCKEGFMMGWGKHHCRCCGGVACDGSLQGAAVPKVATCNSKCFDADLLLNAVGHMDLSAAEKLLHQGVGYNGDPKPGVDPSFTTS